MSSCAAWVAASAGDMAGIVNWWGKNCAVPVTRMPWVSGI
jgi:hypothetical protein